MLISVRRDRQPVSEAQTRLTGLLGTYRRLSLRSGSDGQSLPGMDSQTCPSHILFTGRVNQKSIPRIASSFSSSSQGRIIGIDRLVINVCSSPIRKPSPPPSPGDTQRWEEQKSNPSAPEEESIRVWGTWGGKMCVRL